MDMALPQEMHSALPEQRKMGTKPPMESLTNSSSSWIEMASDLTVQPLLDIGKSLLSALTIFWPF